MWNVLLVARAGDALPALELPSLTRATLALYAGGSGDHLPLHIDSDFARAAGYRDQFMHGMLGAAYITRMITAWVPQEYLRDFRVTVHRDHVSGRVAHRRGNGFDREARNASRSRSCYETRTERRSSLVAPRSAPPLRRSPMSS